MRNRWLAATLIALVGVTWLLLATSLLWTVPVPIVVTAGLYLAAAALILGYARRDWRGSVGLLVGTLLTATVVAVAVLTFYQPPAGAIRQALADTGVVSAADSDASGCRYLCIMNDGPSGLRGFAQVPSPDPAASCQAARNRLAGQGWTLDANDPAGCPASLHQPAPLGRTYQLTLDTSHDPAGRLVLSLRAA